MRIDIGAGVRTGDGKDAGTVHKVIIDPEQDKVTHLVVRTGLLFRRLIVVPLDKVGRANRLEVNLQVSEQELNQMPDFVHTEYAAPPEGWVPTVNYPAGSILWPGGYANVPIVVEQEKAVPENSVEISRGTEVFALDGKLGVVDEVVVDIGTGKVRGFVVCENEKLQRSVFVPVTWISALGGDRLSLNRTREEAIASTGGRAPA